MQNLVSVLKQPSSLSLGGLVGILAAVTVTVLSDNAAGGVLVSTPAPDPSQTALPSSQPLPAAPSTTSNSPANDVVGNRREGQPPVVTGAIREGDKSVPTAAAAGLIPVVGAPGGVVANTIFKDGAVQPPAPIVGIAQAAAAFQNTAKGGDLEAMKNFAAGLSADDAVAFVATMGKGPLHDPKYQADKVALGAALMKKASDPKASPSDLAKYAAAGQLVLKKCKDCVNAVMNNPKVEKAQQAALMKALSEGAKIVATACVNTSFNPNVDGATKAAMTESLSAVSKQFADNGVDGGPQISAAMVTAAKQQISKLEGASPELKQKYVGMMENIAKYSGDLGAVNTNLTSVMAAARTETTSLAANNPQAFAAGAEQSKFDRMDAHQSALAKLGVNPELAGIIAMDLESNDPARVESAKGAIAALSNPAVQRTINALANMEGPNATVALVTKGQFIALLVDSGGARPEDLQNAEALLTDPATLTQLNKVLFESHELGDAGSQALTDYVGSVISGDKQGTAIEVISKMIKLDGRLNKAFTKLQAKNGSFETNWKLVRDLGKAEINIIKFGETLENLNAVVRADNGILLAKSGVSQEISDKLMADYDSPNRAISKAAQDSITALSRKEVVGAIAALDEVASDPRIKNEFINQVIANGGGDLSNIAEAVTALINPEDQSAVNGYINAFGISKEESQKVIATYVGQLLAGNTKGAMETRAAMNTEGAKAAVTRDKAYSFTNSSADKLYAINNDVGMLDLIGSMIKNYISAYETGDKDQQEFETQLFTTAVQLAEKGESPEKIKTFTDTSRAAKVASTDTGKVKSKPVAVVPPVPSAATSPAPATVQPTIAQPPAPISWLDRMAANTQATLTADKTLDMGGAAQATVTYERVGTRTVIAHIEGGSSGVDAVRIRYNSKEIIL